MYVLMSQMRIFLVVQVIGSMDDRVLPCQDFWNYACHNWVTTNPMPPWASKWSIRDEIAHQGNTLTVIVHFSPIDFSGRLLPALFRTKKKRRTWGLTQGELIQYLPPDGWQTFSSLRCWYAASGRDVADDTRHPTRRTRRNRNRDSGCG